MCIEEQIAELERRRTGLLQKLQDTQDFWEDLESTLSAYQADTVGDLPMDVQQPIGEKLAKLPSESEVELELAKLDQQEGEVLPFVEHRLRCAIPSVALLLSLIDWQVLLALLIPEA